MLTIPLLEMQRGGTGNPENFCPKALEAGIRQGTRAGEGGAYSVRKISVQNTPQKAKWK